MGTYSLIERRIVIPHDAIESKYVVTTDLSCLSFFLFFYISKILLLRELIRISVFIRLNVSQQTQNINSTLEQERPKKSGIMVKSKPSCRPEGNVLKILTDGEKGQASNPNKYRGNKPRDKPSPDPKSKTEFQGRCTDLEYNIFDLGPRASNKFTRKMKELER